MRCAFTSAQLSSGLCPSRRGHYAKALCRWSAGERRGIIGKLVFGHGVASGALMRAAKMRPFGVMRCPIDAVLSLIRVAPLLLITNP
jgi:hypothetical protein